MADSTPSPTPSSWATFAKKRKGTSPLRERPNSHATLLVLLALSSLLNPSCSADPTARLELPQCVQDFTEALRWRHMPVAMNFVAPDGRDLFIKGAQSGMKGLEILDFEVLAISPNEDGKSALATVQFSFMRDGDLTLHHGVEIQHWSLRDGRWVILRQVAHEDPEVQPSPFVAPSKGKR